MSYKLIINYFLQYDFYSEPPNDINKRMIMYCMWVKEEVLCLQKIYLRLSVTMRAQSRIPAIMHRALLFGYGWDRGRTSMYI